MYFSPTPIRSSTDTKEHYATTINALVEDCLMTRNENAGHKNSATPLLFSGVTENRNHWKAQGFALVVKYGTFFPFSCLSF